MQCLFCKSDYESGRVRALLLAHTDAHLGGALPLMAEGDIILARVELYHKRNGGYICWDCVSMLRLMIGQAIERFENVSPHHV